MITPQMRWPEFEAHGFAVVPSEPSAQPQDAATDPIRLLAPYGPMDIRFCRAWSDAVRVARDRKTYTAFGLCPFGVFARDDDTGSIVLMAVDRATFSTDPVPVNTGFAQFVACYSAFLAAVFLAKSRAATETGLEYLTDCAAWLGEQMRGHDPGALADGAFWDHLIYYLEDDGVPLRTPLGEWNP